MFKPVCVGLLLLVASRVHAERLVNPQDIHERGEEYGSIAFSPDGARFYTAGDGQRIKVRDTETGKLLAQINEQERCYTWALATSPSGETLAASHGYSGHEEGLVRLFDANSGQLKAVLRGHQRVVRSIAFSADSGTVVTCGDDRMLRWWDATRGREIAARPTAGVLFDFDSKSGLIAVAAGNSGVELWDLSSKRPERSMCDGAAVYRVAISAGGRSIATSGPINQDRGIRIWDTASGKLQATFGVVQHDSVARLAFSPDGELVASATLNGIVTLWDAATGKQLDNATGGCTSGLRFSPSGRRLAQVYGISDSNSGVKTWRVATD